MDSQAFGNRIRERREEVGVSQKDVAAALNIDQGKVSLIEKGLRKVDVVKELPALAKVLQCPISWFYGEEHLNEKELTGNDPVKSFVARYFPDIEFSEYEIRRITQFLEPVLKSYVTLDPDFKDKIHG